MTHQNTYSTQFAYTDEMRVRHQSPLLSREFDEKTILLSKTQRNAWEQQQTYAIRMWSDSLLSLRDKANTYTGVSIESIANVLSATQPLIYARGFHD